MTASVVLTFVFGVRAYFLCSIKRGRLHMTSTLANLNRFFYYLFRFNGLIVNKNVACVNTKIRPIRQFSRCNL